MSTQLEIIRRRRVVLTAIGSLGDLNPYLALALGLQARGHDAVVAASACYRQKSKHWAWGFDSSAPTRRSLKTPP